MNKTPEEADDATTVVRDAAATVRRLAFLPTNAKDEEMIDRLVARRLATKTSRPI